jgi:menaquinone-9 beta-reductase
MQYDTIIIGGGLGGLIASIQLAEHNLNVLLIEKYSYPFHKVCGEYISNEVKPFIESIGVNLEAIGASSINKFQLTALNGKNVNSTLKMGGFGISRYTIDNELYRIAKNLGVHFILNTTVEDIQKINEVFFIDTNNSQTYEAKLVIGAYGKRAKIDKTINRTFSQQNKAFVGVKYHIKYDFPKDLIALHNFDGGYCGISAIEDDKYCLCYLAEREALRNIGGIEEFQDEIMRKNPKLNDIFKNAEFVFSRPLVINEVTFVKKTAVHDHILMVGDTAGLITPLAGNGMSMAIRASYLLSELIVEYFQNKISRISLEKIYTNEWNKNFRNRLWRGRQLQKLLGKEKHSNTVVSILKTAPFLLPPIIKATHGESMKF